jgi:hypothetical protein
LDRLLNNHQENSLGHVAGRCGECNRCNEAQVTNEMENKFVELERWQFIDYW